MYKFCVDCSKYIPKKLYKFHIRLHEKEELQEKEDLHEKEDLQEKEVDKQEDAKEEKDGDLVKVWYFK